MVCRSGYMRRCRQFLFMLHELAIVFYVIGLELLHESIRFWLSLRNFTACRVLLYYSEPAYKVAYRELMSSEISGVIPLITPGLAFTGSQDGVYFSVWYGV